jgi:hypothetical protein
MLGGCRALLLNLFVQAQSPNTWQWQPYPGYGCSDHDAYQLLTSQDSVTLGAAEDLLWHKQVLISVWRLLRDRLTTKVNLVTRGIISPKVHLCVSTCGGVESAQHLFISCRTFDSLWALVRSWIGFSAVDSQNLSDHFV